MNWTLEVVVVPVSDVDRAKAFYAEQVGFTVDHDSAFGDDLRVERGVDVTQVQIAGPSGFRPSRPDDA